MFYYKIDHDNDAPYIEYAVQLNGKIHITRYYKASGNTVAYNIDFITGKITNVTPLKQRFYAMQAFKEIALGDYIEF